MSRMSGILILSYRLKEVTNSYVLHCFWTHRIVHISTTRCLIEMGFIYLFLSFFFNLGDPFNALALIFLGAQVWIKMYWVWIKMWHFIWTRDLYWKNQIEYCWHVTHSPWSCHICAIEQIFSFGERWNVLFNWASPPWMEHFIFYQIKWKYHCTHSLFVYDITYSTKILVLKLVESCSLF